jgi:hypothetical protein
MQMDHWTPTIPVAACMYRDSNMLALLASTLAGLMQVDLTMLCIPVAA